MFKKEWVSLTLAALSAFCVYTCMYSFRKPFTAANFTEHTFLKIDYKVWLVVAQTIGYTLSKFYGIKFIAELKSQKRSVIILSFIGISWIALLLFAITPAPYNIFFLLLNGFPLGMIYGLVFSYLEGRRSTELLGAVLATSFIFCIRLYTICRKIYFTKLASERMVDAIYNRRCFFVPTILFTLLLEKTPKPNAIDIEQRTERKPMSKHERKNFIKTFLPGIVLLIFTYVLLTIIRDYRSNFASNIWTELGMGNNAAVFTQSELPASLVTLGLLGMLVIIKSNIKALLINHAIIATGFFLSIIITLLYINGHVSPFWWMTLVGIGLYMGYVPFNCMLFERLIASFRYVSNAGFIIYLADSFGYLGSDAVLIAKNFMNLKISWTQFFIQMVFVFSGIGVMLITLSAFILKENFITSHKTFRYRNMSKSAIVIGAGIVGLATARALGIRNYKVTVLERSEKAVGASIRNFGMIWPVGQPSGSMYERALLSKNIWKQICTETKIWYDEVGSLHMAYDQLEHQVLEEFYNSAKYERSCRMLTAAETIQCSEAVVEQNLLSALKSNDELIVDPREAIAKLPVYLNQKYNVEFMWSSGVTKVSSPSVWCGNKVYNADEIFVCNGADFETLFPELFSSLPLTKCKLQMMRMAAQDGWRIGPALCGGLSLIHYKSFQSAPSLNLLKEKYETELPDYLKWGIHVMVSQNESGHLTIGDSHEYGQTFDPFDKVFINEMILKYLGTFAKFKNENVVETWNGIYSKLTDGTTEIVLNPVDGVTIINGLGGAGMTLSFGLCEQVIASAYL